MGEYLSELDRVHLSVGADDVSWSLEPSREFAVKPAYNKLCLGDLSPHLAGIWQNGEGQVRGLVPCVASSRMLNVTSPNSFEAGLG
jgi:hypothetical protein